MLREEIRAYRDADGLVSPDKTFPGQRSASGNGVLYTSEYFITLARRGEFKWPEDFVDFLSTTLKCKVREGLYRRGPVHPDQQGPDDYVGLAAAARYVFSPIPWEILDYGRRTVVRLWGIIPLRYWYNNVKPGELRNEKGQINWSAWLGRQPQVIAHLEVCAGLIPPLWRRIYWAFAVAASGLIARKDDKGQEIHQDSWMLTWLLVDAAQSVPCRVMQAARRFWLKRLELTFTGEMQGVCARTLRDPEHPLGKAFRA